MAADDLPEDFETPAVSPESFLKVTKWHATPQRVYSRMGSPNPGGVHTVVRIEARDPSVAWQRWWEMDAADAVAILKVLVVDFVVGGQRLSDLKQKLDDAGPFKHRGPDDGPPPLKARPPRN
jgi:hypothetical protein